MAVFVVALELNVYT